MKLLRRLFGMPAVSETPEQPSIAESLSSIEQLLREDSFHSQANHVERLLVVHRSTSPADQAEFRRLLTADKYLWLGMGTIADVCMSSPTRDSLFRSHYRYLASACEASGFGSIYSRDILSTFRA